MASVFLIRHGQASFGSSNYDRLSDLGCRQAEVLGSYLSTCGIRFDAVYSGALERQRKTAVIATQGMLDVSEHHVDPRFDEVDNDGQVKALLPAILEQQPHMKEIVERATQQHSSKDYQKVIEQVFNRWVELDDDGPQGLQSWADYSTAARAGLAHIMRNEGSGKTVGLFASGGTIATLVAGVVGLRGTQIYSFYEPMVNCSITCLLYSGERASLSYFNDFSYLQLLGGQLDEHLVTYR